VSLQCSATETSIRQLIVKGKTKTALDNAKDFHKKAGSGGSEILLIDAYLARIRALSEQNLALEAKSLIALVRERFPSARERLDALNAAASARNGNLDELLRPLNEPGLSAERRSAIEQFIQNEVTDVTALAGCASLPPEHGLRRAAAAIDKAFDVVTSGPVSDEQIALAEVSHRSPLAPWKLLIRAIAGFYRDQDKSCEEYLAAIKPESAPGRLVPTMRAMLGGTSGAKHLGKSGTPLKPAETALLSRTTASLDRFRTELAKLDRAFEHAPNPTQVFKAIGAAVKECRQSAPNLLAELQHIVFVRGEVAGIDHERMIAALDGTPRRDAALFRDLARSLELTGDSEEFIRACEWWDSFRLEAVREGWFAERGVEAAALYLHMAGLLARMSPEMLNDEQQPVGRGVSRESLYFQFPEELFARACALDPHPDAFSQWLRWARQNSVGEAENVARAWNKALPDAIEPLLFLMEEAEKRNAFPTALSYLDKAEGIDAVNSRVRAARLRLLAAGVLRHLQQKKPHLAAQRLDEIAALPQSQQGHRPALVGALRYLICLASGDRTRGAEALLEVERVLGDSLGAMLLIFGCAVPAKQDRLVALPPIRILSEQQRFRLPASMAKVLAAVKEIGLASKFELPITYLNETEVQFSGAAASLDIEQIRSLGDVGVSTQHLPLAWAASAAGLKHGGPSEAYFLLMRARALPEGLSDRYDVLMAAAAELGRFHRDMEVVDRAVEAGRNPYDDNPLKLTLDQAREVLRKEKESPAFPSPRNPGPDYSYLLYDDEPCMCPACRGKRAGASPDGEDEPYIDEEMERSFYAAAPGGIPPEILPALLEVAKEAYRTGSDPEELMEQILAGMGGKTPGGKKKKGKRG
jgi:tetratricopeptide (TPR) repeat protein